jgi:hypothetical protein
MSERTDHLFQFDAQKIAAAAEDETAYHEDRMNHWQERAATALERVKATVSAKVTEQEVTNGTQAAVVVEYGYPEAWREYQLAYRKIDSHRAAMERYATDARLYATQGDRTYNLDSEDVHHFRLGGQPRDE